MSLPGYVFALTLLAGVFGLAGSARGECSAGLSRHDRWEGGAPVDLSRAVVVTPPNLSGPEAKAVAMLVEEVEKRTRIRWPVVHAWPAGAEGGDGPPAVIAVGRLSALSAVVPGGAVEWQDGSRRPGREGYHLRVWAEGRTPSADAERVQASVRRSSPVVLVGGRDARGVLFGVGRLLRNLRMERDRVVVPADLNLTTSPRYPLRGHQLGYRPKTNSYDAWTVPMWEQYIRDLVVFGANAVELIPPRSDDEADSPHFPLPPMEMMVEMARLLDAYGLDVWVWYPAMDRDYADPATVEAALREWGEVFRRLPRLDAVFVPGGDPGHTPPKTLMALLQKQAASLRRHHPKAQMWVSPQGFTREWMEEFLQILQDERPSWLTGIVFGPQVRLSLPALRARIPKHYPIRHYPDITHCRQCQYPVVDWDVAFARTEGREPINPRPMDQARIFRLLQRHTIGFITYSEGCNDDVNKAVWSGLGWDPDADVVDILREYSRYFIGDRWADPFAQGLLALERNWQGPLASNAGVYTTLRQFQAMEREATPQVRLNWRLQQALYRAYYDAFLRRRLLYERELEEQAMERLRGAAKAGSLLAMAEAEAVLNRALTHPVGAQWRARVFELAEALYQSIRMQLSVVRYQAIAVERGANLDSIDAPLNDRVWLLRRFAQIRQMEDEAERLRAIEEILGWTDPGPGGFYDDLGDPTRRPHLLVGVGLEGGDPGSYESARTGFSAGIDGRMAWARHAESLYDVPLRMRYTGLDPDAAYRIRVVYAGDSPNKKIRLVAGEDLEVHPLILKPSPPRPLQFDLPAGAIRNGELTLSWYGEPGLGGNGRGCQVSEVWLVRRQAGEDQIDNAR